MKAINVIPQLWSGKDLRPSTSHVSKLISEEVFVHNCGKPVAIYQKVPFDTRALLDKCLHLKFGKAIRYKGLVTYTIQLNASPRRPKLDNKCHLSRLRRQQPVAHEVFLQSARHLSRTYLKYFRPQFAAQVKATYRGSQKVDAHYRISGTPFTGGVINKDSALTYHYDRANTSYGISCMLILKAGIAGGELILPELNIGFVCQNNYMLLFDGKTFLHGVTPIIKSPHRNGYRYTVVFYNNSGMHLCLPPEQEELHYRMHLENQSEKRFNKRIKQ